MQHVEHSNQNMVSETGQIRNIISLVEKNNWTRLGPIDPIGPISKTSLNPIY